MSVPADTIESDSWSSEEFHRWIRSLDATCAPPEVNAWLRIRLLPQHRAYDRALDADTRREWAEVFLSLVGCAERFAEYDSWEAALDRANMRALLINELGPVGDETWNPDALLRNILSTLTLQPEGALALSQHWRDLPATEILLLQRHKQLVGGPLETVVAHVADGPDADLAQRWLITRLSLL
jgi:hypothetical protein